MKPILFSTPMVQALLNTKPDTWPAEPIDPSRPFKSQTRRVAEMPPAVQGRDYRYDGDSDGCHYLEQVIDGKPTENYLDIGKAAYQAGDKFWVRETWRLVDFTFIDGTYSASVEFKDGTRGNRLFWRENEIEDADMRTGWRSPYHLHKKNVRLFLEVKEVRMERLQDITEADAKAEGSSICFWFRPYGKPDEESICFRNEAREWEHPTHKAGFFYLWDSLNGKKGLGYESNPWVWVYEFMRVEG